MRWWGWGDPEREAAGGHAAALLAERLGLPASGGTSRVEFEQVTLPPSALRPEARVALAAAAGSASAVRDDREARIRFAAGRGLPDLLRLRAGRADPAPDAVVVVAEPEAVGPVLEACAAHGVAVVPFGGGTSVVGGVEPLSDGHTAVIALDLAGLDGLAVDRRSLLATAGAGLTLPELERRLGAQGLTLGHVPQSFELATVGGCVATRSAGQASTGVGRIDALLRGARLVAPAGELVLPALPPNAAGPDLRQLVAGSEGALGVIAEATLSVRPAMAVRRYEGLAFGSFAEGVEALRACAQRRVAPDVVRLSDEDETELTLAMASSGGAAALAARAYLRARGVAGGCLAIVGWEGQPDSVRRRRAASLRELRRGGAVALGTAPGRAWARGRFDGPYLRDDLLDAGALVETLETAHTWSGLERLHRAVGAALREHAPLVGCHVSHVYPAGASLYFTFLAPARAGEELAWWRAAKAAASAAIVAEGATITHHHAIGRDHAAHLVAEAGELGVELVRAAKQRLDPAGIMNPGKLLAG